MTDETLLTVRDAEMLDHHSQDFHQNPISCRCNGDKASLLCSVVLLASSFLAMGCSRSTGTYPVTGVVKQSNGQPLAGGRILFQPTGEATQPAKGKIEADGSFRLGTFNQSDGAVAGVHKVGIYPFIPEEALNNAAAVARYRSLVPALYQNIQTTPLECTVKSDGSKNHFDIVLEPDGDQKKK